MISAKEAREKSKAVKDGDYERRLKDIENLINESVSKGGTSITCDGILTKLIRDELESLGYEITNGSKYNERYYRISW